MSFADELSAIEERFKEQMLATAPNYFTSLRLSVSKTSRTVTRSTGNFVADGVTTGTFVQFGSFSKSSNNNVFEVEAVAASALVVKDPDENLQDENGSGIERYGFPTYPMAFENYKFTPPDPDKTYVTCFVIPGEGNQASLGNDPFFTYVGIIQNSVYAPEGQGSTAAKVIVDRMASIWRRAQFSKGNSGVITCDAPKQKVLDYRTLSRLGTREGRLRIDLTTPFRRYTKF